MKRCYDDEDEYYVYCELVGVDEEFFLGSASELAAEYEHYEVLKWYVQFNRNALNVGVTERIESPDIFKDFACIVSAVDNKTFREMMFRAAETMDFHWIDLRSEGRSIAYYVKHKKNTLDVMLGTLPKEGGEDGSCQLEYEKNAGIIQNGNKIIAEMGAQLLLNWQRNEASKPQYIDRI